VVQGARGKGQEKGLNLKPSMHFMVKSFWKKRLSTMKSMKGHEGKREESLFVFNFMSFMLFMVKYP